MTGAKAFKAFAKWGWVYLCMCLMVATYTGGCSFGGGTKVQSETRSTTTGQELLDLQKAYESGTITQKEYEKQKQRILRGK